MSDDDSGVGPDETMRSRQEAGLDTSIPEPVAENVELWSISFM